MHHTASLRAFRPEQSQGASPIAIRLDIGRLPFKWSRESVGIEPVIVGKSLTDKLFSLFSNFFLSTDFAFVFLGSKYDAVLKEVYTQSSPKNILEPRSFLAAVFEDTMADNAPFACHLKKYVTEDMLEEIAREYKRGRLLLVATTNLDACQAVIWNMGKIAASSQPEALNLFHKIMLASTAIPGAFPPVMIEVEANGQRYQEMHVYVGAMAQVFLISPSLKVSNISKQQGIVRERRLYVIRNAHLDPELAEVERRTLSIVARATSSLIQTQGIGDLYNIYAETQRDGIDFNLAYVPKNFNNPYQEEFDTEYMRRLFQAGFELAVKGYPWEKKPPGL